MCLLSSLMVAGEASAQGRVEIEKARAAYLARNYADAEQRLKFLVDPRTGFKEPGLLSQARMYLAATYLAQGKRPAAIETLEKLVLEDPTFEPDPLSFPGEVINTFIDVRANLQERLRQAAQNAARLEAERKQREVAERARQEEWLRQVKEMAQEEKITIKNQRLVAFVPFGAGQFQNHQPALGWLFLTSEAALAAAASITVPMYSYAIHRQNEERASGDIDQKAQLYRDRATDIRIVNLSLIGALAAVAITGVVQANVAFVDSFTETKKRPLPSLGPVSRIAPVVSPIATEGAGQSGLYFGVTGTLF